MNKINIDDYKILLFDADGTLLDFDRAEEQAVVKALEKNGVKPSREIIEKYSQINLSLWKKMERGEINREDIMERRFKETFEFFELPYCSEMNIENDYFVFLAEEHELITDAEEVCRRLSQRHRMYIVTNGTARIQHSRWNKSGLNDFFDGVFISEELGFHKPSRDFFHAVFERAGIREADKPSVLLIGDSYSSDITGAFNAGIMSCWFNPKGEALDDKKAPDYEIRELKELL